MSIQVTPDGVTASDTGLRYDPTAQYAVTTTDVEYRTVGDLRLSATVYQPEGTGPFPLLLDLHGGGWSMYDRHRDAPVDRELASHGLVVAALDFRLRDQAVHPADMQDINYAIRWFKAHAADFGASAASVGIIGFSTGGHQVVLSGLRPSHPSYVTEDVGVDDEPDARLDYLISCGCVYDLVGSLTGHWQGELNIMRVDAFFGGIADILNASPLHIIRSDEEVSLPPLLLVQAGADDLSGGQPQDAARFALEYAQRGGFVELAIVPRAGHIFLNPGLVKPTEGMWRGQDAIKSFIYRQVQFPTPVLEPSL